MFSSKNIKEFLIEVANMYIEKEDELSELDAVIGDGDHGISMARGAKFAKSVIMDMSDYELISEYFKNYGRALIRSMGGAMGPLVGIIFTEFGKTCKEDKEFGAKQFAAGLQGSTFKVQDFGGARLGDKTMVDAMIPTTNAVQKAFADGKDFNEILKVASLTAKEAVQATIPLQAKMGRSKWLREKSIGHQDAGATSYYYLMNKFKEFASNL